MPHAGVRLDPGRLGAATLPYSHTRPRSLRIRSTIITCSAASLLEADAAPRGRPDALGLGAGPRARALDRLGPHLAPVAAQEPLGRQADDAVDERAEARLGRAAAPARTGRPGRRRTAPRAARTGWPRYSSPASIRRRQSATAARCPAAPLAASANGVVRAPARRPTASGSARHRAAATRSAARRRHGVALGRPQRLEPPPLAVVHDHVVVEGERERRPRDRRGRARRAAARPSARGRSRASRPSRRRPTASSPSSTSGCALDRRERVVDRRPPPAPAPSRARVRPPSHSPDQRERALVAAQPRDRLRRREVATRAPPGTAARAHPSAKRCSSSRISGRPMNVEEVVEREQRRQQLDRRAVGLDPRERRPDRRGRRQQHRDREDHELEPELAQERVARPPASCRPRRS